MANGFFSMLSSYLRIYFSRRQWSISIFEYQVLVLINATELNVWIDLESSNRPERASQIVYRNSTDGSTDQSFLGQKWRFKTAIWLSQSIWMLVNIEKGGSSVQFLITGISNLVLMSPKVYAGYRYRGDFSCKPILNFSINKKLLMFTLLYCLLLHSFPVYLDRLFLANVGYDFQWDSLFVNHWTIDIILVANGIRISGRFDIWSNL